jgi:serine/threonine-protein kinase
MSPELPSAGRYEIVEKIGAGGMGSVYRAKDPVIGRSVAVKAIAFADVPDPKERREMQIRTAREARSAGMLSHPNIVTVHDIGQESGLAFIVMELVEGPTLWELFCQKGKLGKSELFKILEGSAAALDYAHGHGVIHRDVKPSNILVRPDGVAKLTDFGVAKILAAEQLTRTGLVVGTPNYMAPEQIKEQNVTPASDQFGLAVIAYELLTGSKPFDGGTFSSLLYKIMAEPTPPATELNPRLPSAAEEVLEKALAKDPEKRYENCGAFVKALADACVPLPEDGLGERKKTEAALKPPPEDESVERLSLDQLRKVDATGPKFHAPLVQQEQPKSRRNLIIGAAAAVLLLAAIVGLLMSGGGAEEADQDPPPPMVLAENDPPEAAPTQSDPSAAVPSGQPAASNPPAAAPPPSAAPQPPAAQPSGAGSSSSATVAPETPIATAPLLVGATTTIVWRGQLDPGADLVIEGDTASAGEISRGLPGAPVEIEVSPNVLEIREAPSAANGWKVLRLHNGGDRARRYFIIRCKSM